MKMKKGQSATEYLMTYGWALLAIVVVAAVLWRMGIFGGTCGTNIGNQPGAQITLADIKVAADGTVSGVIKNGAGEQITINGTSADTTISVGGTTLITDLATVTAGTAGDCYTDLTVTVNYQTASQMQHALPIKVSGAYE